MLVLMRCIYDCGITQEELAKWLGLSRYTVIKYLNNRNNDLFMTRNRDDFRRRVQALVEDRNDIQKWLSSRKKTVEDLFTATKRTLKKKFLPKDHRERINESRKFMQGFVLEHPETIKPRNGDDEMITSRALKHFKLFRSPFMNDVTTIQDIYMSEDHRFLKEMMLNTARYQGFTAIFGEVGSGKSIMRKAVVEELKSEGIRVVFPVIIDKERITPASLIDAIIMDITEDTPKRYLEQKTRQALNALSNRASRGMKQVLMIEEAHLLNKGAMKALKQIYELENGMNKLIGIILIGQPELKLLLNEDANTEIREVIRRVTCAEIRGFDEELVQYLEYKFKRIKVDLKQVFADDAFDALRNRLRIRMPGGRYTSTAFPLSVNNLVIRSMNLAAETGEKQVTSDLVMAV